MNKIPLPIRIILNIIIFIVYWLVWSFIWGFILWIFSLFGFDLPADDSPVYNYISLAALVIILVLTLYFKDKFYLVEKKESESKDETKEDTDKKEV